MSLGSLDQASSSFEQALRLQPDHVGALHNRSVVELERGDLAAARELNRRTLELDPTHEAARLLAERLAQSAEIPTPPAWSDPRR
jgi:tetratricopeptide (TPR) repeat protein